MASPRKQANGKWRADVMVGGERHSKTFNLKRDAKTWIDQVKTDHARGVFIPPDRQREKVADRLDAWLDMKAADPNFADSSYVQYEIQVRVHIKPYLGNLTLEHLGVEAIERWRNTLVEQQGTSTAKHAYKVLSVFCSDQVRFGYMPQNTASLVKAPRHVQREMTVLEPHELNALVDALKGQSCSYFDEDGALRWCRPGHPEYELRSGWASDVALGLALIGCRIGDLTVLRPEHWDRINGKLTVHDRKTGRTRVLPVFPAVAEVLDRCVRRGGEFLFMTDGRRGQHKIHHSFSNVYFRPAVEKAGIGREFVPHQLRHTAASILIRKGFDAVHVAAYLGHANPSITRDTYSHLFVDDMDDIGDALNDMWETAQQGPGDNVTSILRAE